MLEREGDVRIDKRIRKSVIFLGSSDRGTFVPAGTAFITLLSYDGQGFQTLVTAKHVIDMIPGKTVYARLNTIEGGRVSCQSRKLGGSRMKKRTLMFLSLPRGFRAKNLTSCIWH
jgi:hypothetical protein